MQEDMSYSRHVLWEGMSYRRYITEGHVLQEDMYYRETCPTVDMSYRKMC